MHVAVFTSQFPTRVSTFFARDMRGLLEAGVELDIFSMYPLDPTLWQYVPDILNEEVLPRDRVHHLSHGQALGSIRPQTKPSQFLKTALPVCSSAVKFGIIPLAKSTYALLKARAWAEQQIGHYDHILAYWGNYAATCAYAYHHLIGRQIPFSVILHAGTDLYRNQVYLRQKLLHADNIFVVCEFNRQFLQSLYPDAFEAMKPKIHLHHLGLDLADFSFSSDTRPPRTIVAVGAHEKAKGFDYLLRAAHQLTTQGLDIEVELVGQGKETRALRKLAAKLGISERVKFQGWLHPDEVKSAMKRATLLVHPSAGLGDAVPTVVKEAMAVGTPVVASDVAGIPELLNNGRCGILVPPQDVQALATGIARMLSSDLLRRQFAESAREYVEERFDLWKNTRYLADRLRATTRHTINQKR